MKTLEELRDFARRQAATNNGLKYKMRKGGRYGEAQYNEGLAMAYTHMAIKLDSILREQTQ